MAVFRTVEQIIAVYAQHDARVLPSFILIPALSLHDAYQLADVMRQHGALRTNLVYYGKTKKGYRLSDVVLGSEGVQCAGCDQTKPRSEFYMSRATKDTLSTLCKQCTKLGRVMRHRRAYELRATEQQSTGSSYGKRYGLTEEQTRALIEYFDGKCGICGIEPDYVLCLDHSHVSGRVRGLLCRSCNAAIGLLGDNVANILTAAQWVLQDGVYTVLQLSPATPCNTPRNTQVQHPPIEGVS